MQQSPITYHNQYEKITDDIMFLGFNTILRMNVVLAKKMDDGRRYHYHNEYMYETNKYVDTNNIITLRRSFDYYMTIENVKSINQIEKEFIMIRVQDILFVRDQLNIIYNWFTSPKSNVYANSNGRLILVEKVDPVIIPELAGGKFLMFEPTIIQYDNGNMVQGTRLFLSSEMNYVDISIDKFMGLKYILDSINMYMAAQNIINYLGNPGYGTNLNVFSMGLNEVESFMEIKSNRQIPYKEKGKSFFDKMDDM